MDTLHALFIFMPRFTHLIFDLDGTLVDTKADLAAATNHMLQALDLPTLTVSQVERYIGDGARVLVERTLGPNRKSLTDQGLTVFLEYYTAHLLDHSRLYAGIATLLHDAHARGTILSILTNKPEVPSRAIVSGLAIAQYFTAVVGGDTLPVRKPDPQGVVHLRQLTGISLAQTLLVGDSRIDVETGRAAGVTTCGVTWGCGAAGLVTTPPEFVVDSVEQLRRVIFG
jgi:phosphoglycolate phosphatase